MRIAWLSPAAGNSGVVEYTRQVLPAVARHADVELWGCGAPEAPPADVPYIDYAAHPAALAQLPHFDSVFYHLGNHLAFHRSEYEASRACPGIVVLHDRTLHHFFAGYYIAHLRAPERYLARMTDLHGPRGAEVARAVIAQAGEAAWAYPEEVLAHAFIEQSLRGAIGAVVHSAGHAEAVRGRWAGPVLERGIPAYDTQLATPRIPPPPRDGRLTLMSIGHVDTSKQINTLVTLLADAPELAERVRYLIIGQYDPRSAYVRDVHRTIADGGLAKTVKLLGYVAPRSLEHYAAEADIFVNLRRPNLEGGSASLMEQLARGRPIVVYDSGTYGELPDDVVAKVAAGDQNGLGEVLWRLVGDAELRERLGIAARRFAESRRVDEYGESLVQFARRAARIRPRLQLSDSVGRRLTQLGVAPGGAAIGRLAGTLEDLLG